MRDVAALEQAYRELVDQNPEAFAVYTARLGSLAQVRRSMSILIRREQEGDPSVTPVLDRFENLLKEARVRVKQAWRPPPVSRIVLQTVCATCGKAAKIRRFDLPFCSPHCAAMYEPVVQGCGGSGCGSKAECICPTAS